jgi:hypothetical protein
MKNDEEIRDAIFVSHLIFQHAFQTVKFKKKILNYTSTYSAAE